MHRIAGKPSQLETFLAYVPLPMMDHVWMGGEPPLILLGSTQSDPGPVGKWWAIGELFGAIPVLSCCDSRLL